MDSKKGLLVQLVPVLLFFILSSIFFAPLYSGKVLVQSDNVQLSGSLKELSDYREKGETIGWNNREFSGLPILKGSEYNPFLFVSRLIFGGFIPKMIMMVVALSFGFYLLSRVLQINIWIAAIGAFAFAFSTFNMVSLEAGHDNKVLAMAFMAPVLAGVILTYRGSLLKGGLLTAIAAGFQLVYGHVQITYYLFIMVLAYLILVIYKTYKDGTWRLFLKSSGMLLIASLIAIGANFGQLYSTIEYSGYSTRGGSELTTSNQPDDGLSKEYAMAWSSGILETLTTMFPYFHGGATGEELSEDSKTYQILRGKGVDQQTINNVTGNVPLYWGKQPFTAGPIYFGITMVFLFIMGMLLFKDPIKWWIAGLTLLSILLAMGKNLSWFNDLFFYYVPMYNKFRSVTMSFSIAQLLVPLMAVLVLNKLTKEKINYQLFRSKFYLAAGITGGIGIFFLLFRNAFFDFRGVSDVQYFAQFPEWLVNAIIEDRKSKFNGDIIRSLFFILLLGGGIWMYEVNKISSRYFLIGISLLVLVDLWSVNKRYIATEDFQRNRQVGNQVFQPSAADQQILQDDSYYRVFNSTRRLDQDGLTSYHHYSIGGYNAIKMQRYQELIDRYISQGNRDVLNMLNVKYFIVQNETGLVAQRNPGALGNAWTVTAIEVVENADEEIEGLSDIDPSQIALVDKRFARYLEKVPKTYSGQTIITFHKYHPELMTYSFSSSENQFVVFSEIYYQPGWNAYIDGERVEHVRVNYVLRGLYVPAGDHEIQFKYEPTSEVVGDTTALISLLGVFGMIGITIYYTQRRSES